MATKKQQQQTDNPIPNFDPLKLIEDSITSGFDPSMTTEIDERDLNWCPNIWSWITDPDYLGITTIYPIQMQVLLRLFGDVCPYCSDYEFYLKDFDVLSDMGNVRDRLTLLNFGKCPKCGKTRLDHYNAGMWDFPNELDLLWGMRCVLPELNVFTSKGLKELKNVEVGDVLSHGVATKKFDSGTLPSLTITTDMNWSIKASKESHIMPVLNENLDLEHRLIKTLKVGDTLVLHSPNLWPTSVPKLPQVKRLDQYPTKVTKELARLTGYLVSNGSYGSTASLQIASSDEETTKDKLRCLDPFDIIEPTITSYNNTDKCIRICMPPYFKDWLHVIRLAPATAHNKSIPNYILESPKEIVCEFLAGLFEGDGGLYVEKVDHRRKVLLYYTSASKTLIEQVRLLLLNMGIVTNLSKFVSTGFGKANTYINDIETDEQEGVKYSYRLATKCSKFIEIFKKNVRLVSQDKLDALEFLSDKGRIRYHTPIGDFQLGTKRCPDKITELAKQGYFFVEIKSIRDGEDLPMMDVHIPITNMYTAGGFVHHNSGKSAIVGILSSYHLHRLLKIPDPATYYRLLKGSLLVMRFVALTAGQANESLWHQFTRSIETCAWFDQYHDFLRHHEKRMGVELNKWLTQSFGYVHKKLTGYYLGASIDTSRGRTAVGSFFDEIGWWLGHDQSKRANPHETYQAYQKASRTIRNAAATRFIQGNYDTPTAIMACVSSTSSKADYIMHLIKMAKTDKRRVASHKASWEINPEFALNPDELKAEREANFKTYLRDYGSIPPFADSPFFDNEEAVIRLSKLSIPEWKVTTELGDVGYYLSAENVEKNSSVPYCIAIDLGHNNCGYAAALLKLKETDFTVAQVAGLFAIYPDKKKGESVDMSKSFICFIKKLCELLPIRLIVYDQWQSKTQIQELQGLKIAAEQYSLTYSDFTFFRTQTLQAKLEFPETEMPISDIDKSPDSHQEILYNRPYLHFLWQMLSVSEVGRKIGKGSGHDDLFRAVVLGTKFLWDDDRRREFEYKQGMLLNERRGKGRLVIAGGTKSGGILNTTNTGGFNATLATTQGGKTLGAIITKSKS